MHRCDKPQMKYKVPGAKWPEMDVEQWEKVETNLGIAGQVAKQYLGVGKAVGLSYEDIFQAGCMGLIEASYRYGKKPGNEDVKFSSYAVPWVRQEIQKEIRRSNAIRPPRNHPYLTVVSMDSVGEVSDKPEGEQERPSGYDNEDIKALYDCMGRLDDRGRTALEMRMDGYSLREIGEHFGFCKERARQIVEIAKARISEMMGVPCKKKVKGWSSSLI